MLCHGPNANPPERPAITHRNEPPELVADRLRTVLRFIDAERVHVTPDCGFSQTARFIACRKLANMVQGVRLVRNELQKVTNQ